MKIRDTTLFVWRFARGACLMLAVVCSVDAVARWATGASWWLQVVQVCVFVGGRFVASFVLRAADDRDRRFVRSHRVHVVDGGSRSRG